MYIKDVSSKHVGTVPSASIIFSDPVKLLINKVNAQTQMAIPAYKKLLANKSLRNGRVSAFT